MNHERDEPHRDIGQEALERLWTLVTGRVNGPQIWAYLGELKKYPGPIIRAMVDTLLKDQSLARIPPVGRLSAICRLIESGPVRELPRPPTPVIQIAKHQWYQAVIEMAKEFSVEEYGLYETEAAAQIRKGYDPETATVIAYGSVIATRAGGQLGQDVQDLCGLTRGKRTGPTGVNTQGQPNKSRDGHSDGQKRCPKDDDQQGKMLDRMFDEF